MRSWAFKSFTVGALSLGVLSATSGADARVSEPVRTPSSWSGHHDQCCTRTRTATKNVNRVYLDRAKNIGDSVEAENGSENGTSNVND